MESLRKWFYRPKKDDPSLLAQFFHADEALNLIAGELDSFDGRKDPERCTALVNQLRQAQDRVLTITNAIMDALIGCTGKERANREFRVKFPEDVLQDNLAGQLWFGAECLAAGSSIMNREQESAEMRPLAKALTKSLETVRNLLRDTCLKNSPPSENLLESLKIFDRLFANFELKYVSAMVPVKTVQEHELQEMIGVLFSETLQRALKMKLLTQDLVDDCDPALMFTIPRLAIISGLLIYPTSPLCPDRPPDAMSELFRPFRTLLLKIRELLWTLDGRELYLLEKLLCDNDDKGLQEGGNVGLDGYLEGDDFVSVFYRENPGVREYLKARFTMAAGEGTADGFAGSDSKLDTFSTSPSTDLIVKQLYPTHAANINNNNTNLNNNAPDMDSLQSTTVPDRKTSETIDIPSTSASGTGSAPSNNAGYLLTNTIDHDAIAGTNSTSNPHEHVQARVESLPDRDSLQVISVAAATLTSYLSTTGHEPDVVTSQVSPCNSQTVKSDVESATDDSGICTENTSLDRSPSLDLNECSSGGSPKNAPPPPLYQLSSSRQCDKCHNNGNCISNSDNNNQVMKSSAQAVSSSNEHVFQSELDISSDELGVQNRPGSSSSQPNNSSSVTAMNSNVTAASICDKCINNFNSNQQHRSERTSKKGGSSSNSSGEVKNNSSKNHHHHHHRSGGKCSHPGGTKHKHCKSGDDGLDSSSVGSTDTTSSFNSTCADDEEIALAMQAVEIANRNEVRAKFRNSEDLIHRLYVCIAGVADQLQTNFASDLRNILKSVFLINTSPDPQPPDPTSLPTQPVSPSTPSSLHSSIHSSLETTIEFHHGGHHQLIDHQLSVSMEYHPTTTEVVRGEFSVDPNILAQEALFDSNVYFQLSGGSGDEEEEHEICGVGGEVIEGEEEKGIERVEDESSDNHHHNSSDLDTTTVASERPPVWIPDIEAPKCMSCAANFTVVKRRHHCRNCGKVFCARCSSNSTPLPKYGHVKPVRVCNRCFMYDLAPFTR